MQMFALSSLQCLSSDPSYHNSRLHFYIESLRFDYFSPAAALPHNLHAYAGIIPGPLMNHGLDHLIRKGVVKTKRGFKNSAIPYKQSTFSQVTQNNN